MHAHFSLTDEQRLTCDSVYGWEPSVPLLASPEMVGFVRRVFKQSLSLFPDNQDLVLAYVCFESLYAVCHRGGEES